MILFLRNKDNETIAEVEIWVDSDGDYKFVEISPSVDIENYSVLLLRTYNNNMKHVIQIIKTFKTIDNLRGWLWESYFGGGKNDPNEIDNVIKIIHEKFNEWADKLDLMVVED